MEEMLLFSLMLPQATIVSSTEISSSSPGLLCWMGMTVSKQHKNFYRAQSG